MIFTITDILHFPFVRITLLFALNMATAFPRLSEHETVENCRFYEQHFPQLRLFCSGSCEEDGRYIKG